MVQSFEFEKLHVCMKCKALFAVPFLCVKKMSCLQNLFSVAGLILGVTAEPQFYDMARGQQNRIVKSGYPCKRTPDLTIWRQSN